MYKLLLIEDSKEDSDVFLDTIKRMNSEYGAEQYEMITASSYTEGLLKISKDLNGVIVDIKLDNGNSGNEIIREIMQKYRLPVAIFTGTPDTEQDKGSPIIVYRKGEAKQEDIVTNLCRVSDTGLFKVLGGTGIIESAMTQVFWSNLYPQINLWKSKKESGVDTEKVLLRYVISHIQELIDSEMPAHVTEEMYICPPINMGIKTGSIIQKKSDGVYFIVLSPPCDLSVYNGKVKTDYVLLCEIVEQNTVNTEITPAVPNLIERNFHAAAPNQKWLTDITEFAIPAGKVYLSPILDCFDGLLPAWEIGIAPNAELSNGMLQRAISTLGKDHRPIIHTDRGCHYRWPSWISLMQNAGHPRSMSKKGCTPDNAACEGLFGRIKNEMFYHRNWAGVSIEQFIRILNDYLIWYNEKRIKVSLGNRSPLEYRQSLRLAS
jgi:hypothetical protein